MPSGGKRAGAGRKSTFQQEMMAKAIARGQDPKVDVTGIKTMADLEVALSTSRELMVKTILGRQDELVNSMIDLAVGAQVEDASIDPETGQVVKRTYTQLPDRQALAWLLEQAHGKATQKREVQVDTNFYLISAIPRPAQAALAATIQEEIIDAEATVEDEEPEECQETS